MEARAKIHAVHERLCKEYGCPFPFVLALDPLAELVTALLSPRIGDPAAGRARQALEARFGSWSAVMAADPDEISAVIRSLPRPRWRAARLKRTLEAVATDQDGALSLARLERLPLPEARSWLESLPHVGSRTAAAVLLLSRLRRPVLPVDAPYLRVARRLGLVQTREPAARAHYLLEALLPDGWSAHHLYDHHQAMTRHAQRCCFERSPACHRCPVFEVCPTGQARMPAGQSGEAALGLVTPLS